MKKGDVNKGISVHVTMLLLHWTKVCDVVPWTLTSLTKPGIYSNVCDSILHEAGMYCFFTMDGLMYTAYTNLENTFLISFPSKNSNLSSMLEA